LVSVSELLRERNGRHYVARTITPVRSGDHFMSVCSAEYVTSISKRGVSQFVYKLRGNSNQVPSTEISKANYVEHKMFVTV